MNSSYNIKAFCLLLLLSTGGINMVCGQVIDADCSDMIEQSKVTDKLSFLQTLQPLSIDHVTHADFHAPDAQAVMVPNYDPYYYWFRIIVRNNKDLEREIMLLMAPIGLYKGLLFQQKKGQWKEIAHSGLKYPFRERSYLFTHYVFPFTISPNCTDTLYLSVDATNAYKSFGFALLNPKELKIFENRTYFVFGIIVGLLLLFFVLNLSLYFVLRQLLYLWYAFYIILLFLVVMKNDHLDQQFLGLDSEKAFRLSPYMVIGAIAIAVLMHVVQSFLSDTLSKNRVLSSISNLLKWNVLLSAVVHAFVFNLATDYRMHDIVFRWAKISTLLVICMIIIDCFYCFKKGVKVSLFVLSGTFVFLLGSVQRLFFPSSLSFLFPPTTFHIGIILEVFVISIGLIYRYWTEKIFQKETEERVQLRVTRYISNEIHDNVGQDLALAGLCLKTMLISQKDDNEQMKMAKEIFLKSGNENLKLAQETIVKAGRELRHLVHALKDEPSSSLDMISEIKLECDNIRKTGVFEIQFVVHGGKATLSNYIEGMILSVIRGALQNIIKHANPTKVFIQMNYRIQSLEIIIRDDGVGFDTNLFVDSNGLNNIRNRCELMDASCHIESGEGNGTNIEIIIPIV